MLGQVLKPWDNTRQSLKSMSAEQPDVSCRLSLEHMISGLDEAKDFIKALKADHKGKAVPVSEMFDTLRGLAAKYTSIKTQQAEVAAAVAYGTDTVAVPKPQV